MEEQRKPPVLSTAQRLGLERLPGSKDRAAAEEGAEFAYALPEGWESLPPAQFRAVNLRVQGEPDTEIYLSVLPGGGGGVEQNINRWRRQMGQGSATAEDIAALPKKPMLGGEAVYVELAGVYGGMSGAENKADFKLLGLAMSNAENGYFVKMVGPAAVVDREIANFAAFAASLHQHAHEHDDTPTEAAATDPLADGLQWNAPEGWQEAPAREMRLVTFTLAGAEDAECYVSTLGGAAGGIEANLNRWRAQMKKPSLSAGELAALQKVKLLGEEVPLLQSTGEFTGMDGAARPGYLLLGAVRAMKDQTLFVKMTGPEEVVSGQLENFVAFCESLR
ncbi:MAG: hypothetical protein HYV26_12705 [Candidatus Hydrogenedentes bacterium]|nr:hypothetical protein [Candidatus Hydrogenedentota bacterium]